MSKKVRIFDTTLRDGEQTPGVHITADQKVDIAQGLEAFGVTTIEAGFPASSPGDAAAVARVARTIRNCEVAALARCVPGDIDAAAEALRDAAQPVIHVFLGTSDVHLETKLRMTRVRGVRAIQEAVSRARESVAEVQFSAEDATRTERPFLRQCIVAAVEAGATRINVPDTVGCATPREYAALIGDVVRLVGPDIVVSGHCHNDMGMATANTISAVEAGAGQVEVTVNGIGERAGNAAIEEIGVALHLKGIASTGLDLSQAVGISQHVAAVTGVPIQPNRAVVGANAFTHSSGIHQDGILKAPENYEFVPPGLVGVAGHRFVLTARSGRRAVAHQAAAMGTPLDGEMTERVYQAFLEAADAKCGEVTKAELGAIIQRVCGEPVRVPEAAIAVMHASAAVVSEVSEIRFL
jgi:2-isopropylmalate synthase